MADAIGDLALFRAIVAAGGIAAAARALGSSAPAVSRRLAALEARLGVTLAERNARRFRLTEEGALYDGRGQAILAALRDMEAEVAARGGAAHGLLRVGAPMELGRRRIAALLAGFADRHPGLVAHLVLSDAGLEVGSDGLDVALRIGRPEDQSLMALKLATARLVLCAAPGYLARRGTPIRPEDLAGHDCLRLARRQRLVDVWRFRTADGRQDIKVAGRLSSGSGEALHRWALDQKGISREAAWDVAEDLREGRLVEVLADYACESVELFATFGAGRPVPPRIRLFVDFVALAFAAEGGEAQHG